MKLVMFDLDGTLVDSHAFISATMAATFAAEGLPEPTAEQSREVIGLSLPEALMRLSNVSGPALDALVVRYRQIYHSEIGSGDVHELLYAGAREAVLALGKRDDLLLGVATGKALRGVNRILTLHGFTDMFVTLQTPDHNPSKPHPGMLRRAMDETGVSPTDLVMIGDTTFDIEMARAADTWAIGVSWGSHSSEQLLQAGAHVIIDDFGALIPAIESFLGAEHA